MNIKLATKISAITVLLVNQGYAHSAPPITEKPATASSSAPTTKQPSVGQTAPVPPSTPPTIKTTTLQFNDVTVPTVPYEAQEKKAQIQANAAAIQHEVVPALEDTGKVVILNEKSVYSPTVNSWRGETKNGTVYVTSNQSAMNPKDTDKYITFVPYGSTEATASVEVVIPHSEAKAALAYADGVGVNPYAADAAAHISMARGNVIKTATTDGYAVAVAPLTEQNTPVYDAAVADIEEVNATKAKLTQQ